MDGRRHASNIADDDEKREEHLDWEDKEAGDMQRMSEIELLGN